jgi:hypothetical protein
MGSSFISNHIHVVFSTKNRVRSIREQIQPKLWAYMAGIAENHGMHAVKIGGIEDHVEPWDTKKQINTNLPKAPVAQPGSPSSAAFALVGVGSDVTICSRGRKSPVDK